MNFLSKIKSLFNKKKDGTTLKPITVEDMYYIYGSVNQVIDYPVVWNKERDNTNFNLKLEVKMIAEELFELMGFNYGMSKKLSEDFVKRYKRQITNRTNHYKSEENSKTLDSMLDALGDILFISAGSISKLGGKPSKILATINEANKQKGKTKDKDGKIIKDKSTFEEPKHIKDENNN